MNELPDIPPDRSLIEYPSRFPIKVMGAHVEGFAEAIAAVALQFDPEFDAATIEHRPSKGGNYLGLTITITATKTASAAPSLASLALPFQTGTVAIALPASKILIASKAV